MGVIADSIAEYAKPLLDKTDGSFEQVEKAFSIATMCWNISLLPENEQASAFVEFRLIFPDEAEYTDFCNGVIKPMIKRRKDMFPGFSQLNTKQTASPSNRQQATQTQDQRQPHKTKFPNTGRNDMCPCNSGQKYKRCCGNSNSEN